MVPLTYVRAIARAGGRPLLLAPTPADLEDPSELLDLLDGVLVTGGADLDPGAYGAEPHAETERDVGRARRVRAAARPRARPSATCPASASAAACRSSTSPTAARSSSTCPTGSTTTSTAARTATSLTIRSRSSLGASRRSRPAPPTSRSRATTTRASPGSATGCASPRTPRATAPTEAVEDARRRFMLGVLWHPEEDEADRLIGAFVASLPRPERPEAPIARGLR